MDAMMKKKMEDKLCMTIESMLSDIKNADELLKKAKRARMLDDEKGSAKYLNRAKDAIMSDFDDDYNAMMNIMEEMDKSGTYKETGSVYECFYRKASEQYMDWVSHIKAEIANFK